MSTAGAAVSDHKSRAVFGAGKVCISMPRKSCGPRPRPASITRSKPTCSIEPFRREDLAAGSQAEGSDIEARIGALEALTTADLRIEWRRLYRATPPTRVSRDLLIRGVAYKVQEQAHGGLSAALSARRGGGAL
jgi:hypothetical protein